MVQGGIVEIPEAMRIIKTAAEGIDPFTGELFPKDSVYQHPQMVRALYRALGAMEVQQKRELKQKDLPENAGKPWSEAEDARLIAAFDSKTSMSAIARQHKRTVGSIEARLEKLGKIEPQEGRQRY